MENYLSYWKCKKSCCNFYQVFKIPLANYNNSGKCMVDKVQKRHYSFYCQACKMITFSDFEEATNECAFVFLKTKICHEIMKINEGGKNKVGRTKKQ